MTPKPTNVAVIIGDKPAVGRALWLLVVATNVALLLLDARDGSPHPSAWVAAALLAIGAGAALFPAGHPLASTWAWIAAAAAALASTAPFWDSPSESSAYAPWYVRGTTTVLVVLVLRGRPAAAWIGSAAVSGILLSWGILASEDPARWIGMHARQIATLLVVQVLAVALARAAPRITAYRAVERERARSEELRSASIRERRAELSAIRGLSRPLLTRVARGEDGEDLRAEASYVEAELRDLLRGRRLAAEPLSTAAREARLGGMNVALLDDLGDARPDPKTLRDGIAWAAVLLARASGPSATVRLSRTGSGMPLLSVVSGVESDSIEVRVL